VKIDFKSQGNRKTPLANWERNNSCNGGEYFSIGGRTTAAIGGRRTLLG